MENFMNEIDAYRNHYDKKMPISNKVNRYNINDSAIPETKKNNSSK